MPSSGGGGRDGRGGTGATGQGGTGTTARGGSGNESTGTSVGSAGIGGMAGTAATGSGGSGGSSSGGSAGTVTGSGGAAGVGGAAGSGGGVSGAAGSAGSGSKTVDAWPQAGGPDGTFRVDVDDAPITWSVATGKNILWKTDLDNEGQGGIAVAGNLLFLTTFLPFSGSKTSLSIEGYAIDRTTGAIKWRTKPLTGNGLTSGMAYQYSDATSWTPITDGRYVWFFNSAGHMGCWDPSGKPDASGILAPIWEADFAGQDPAFPYNRQHEPFMSGSNVVISSPLGKGIGDPASPHAGWNYLHGIDKMTGKTTWAAEDASTFYNTAVMGKLPDGTPAVVHGRGGPHGVPERPVGLSLTSLAPGSEGKSLWQFKSGGAPTCTGGSATTPQMCTGGSGTALYNMSWDQQVRLLVHRAAERDPHRPRHHHGQVAARLVAVQAGRHPPLGRHDEQVRDAVGRERQHHGRLGVPGDDVRRPGLVLQHRRQRLRLVFDRHQQQRPLGCSHRTAPLPVNQLDNTAGPQTDDYPSNCPWTATAQILTITR